MNKPNSISEYSEILEDIKKQMKLKYSNSLFQKSDIENYIKSDTLYYIKSRYGFLQCIKLFYRLEESKISTINYG